MQEYFILLIVSINMKTWNLEVAFDLSRSQVARWRCSVHCGNVVECFGSGVEQSKVPVKGLNGPKAGLEEFLVETEATG